MLKKLLAVMLLVAFFAPTSALAAQDPIAHWKFDEGAGFTATDSSGNGYDGSLTAIVFGRPTYSTTVAPLNFTNSYSLLFSGTDGLVNVNSGSTPTELLGNVPKSLSMWIYPTRNENGYFFLGQNNGLGQGHTFRVNSDSSGFLEVDVSNGVDTSSLQITLNTWQHLAVVYAGGTDWKVCLDNSCEALTLPESDLGTGRFTIGMGGFNTNLMQGNIDDVRLYDRALDATELSDLASGDELAVVAVSVSNNTATPTSVYQHPSTTETPHCSDQMPRGKINLFQIDTGGNYANLYFTKGEGTVTGYSVNFGLTPDANQFGDNFSFNGFEWIIGRKVTHLSPNTTYYFKVRANNGCNAGEWSNVMQIKTKLSNSKVTNLFSNLSSN